VKVGERDARVPVYSPDDHLHREPTAEEILAERRDHVLGLVALVVFLPAILGLVTLLTAGVLVASTLRWIARFFLGAAGLLFYPDEVAVETLRNTREFHRRIDAVNTSTGAGAGAGAGAAPHPPAPGVPLRLDCPVCGIPHFDEGEWATRPHRTHLCGGCGMKWTPAAYPTVGV